MLFLEHGRRWLVYSLVNPSSASELRKWGGRSDRWAMANSLVGAAMEIGDVNGEVVWLRALQDLVSPKVSEGE